MPTYNRANLIKDTIESVLAQSYTQFELIIIDDGSEDDTGRVVSGYKDDRILYIKKSHAGYIGRLRNEGISRSSGELIALLDSDDRWEKDKLAIQVDQLKANPSAGFCFSDVKVVNHKGLEKPYTYKFHGHAEITSIFNELKDNRFWVYPSTKIFRRYCLEKSGYFNETIKSADFNFTIRLSYFFPAVILYHSLVTRLVHDGNRSEQYSIQNYFDYLSTFEFMLQEKMISEKDLAFAQWNTYYKVGKLYQQKGEAASSRSNYLKALKLKPFHKASYKGLLSSYIRS